MILNPGSQPKTFAARLLRGVEVYLNKAIDFISIVEEGENPRP